MTSAITRPRSRIDVAPVSAIASSTIRSSSSSDDRLGHEPLDDGELALLLGRLLLAPALAKRLGRLGAALALPLEDLKLLLVGERPLELLLGRPKRGQDQPQGVDPLLLAGPHRVLDVTLELRDQAHAMPPSGAPPRMCQWRWKTDCPALGPTLTTTR